MKIPLKMTPAHSTSETPATSFPLGTGAWEDNCLAMNRVMKNDR